MQTPNASMFITYSALKHQFIPVKGIVNARDLGGYDAQDGRRLRSGLLIRAAHLADATDADIKYLESLPLAKIIDFRKEDEKRGKVDRMVDGADYISHYIDASGKKSREASEEEKKLFTSRKQFDIKKIILEAAFNSLAQRIAREMYPSLFFDPDCQKQYAGFFRMVLETEKGAVLYHCTQGKDRTGVASALLLAALGADRETIVADFDATNRVYDKVVRRTCFRIRLMGGKEAEIATVKAFLGANTDNFKKALDRIDQEYGSMDAYLKGPMGLTDADISTLRERYLE